MREVEYLIVGVGTAGLGAYSRIRRKSNSLLLIQHGPFGTTCARVGCMPSKMLVTAGELAYSINQANYFGIDGGYKVDGKEVFARLKRDRTEKFVGGVLKAVDKIPKEIIIRGEARFSAENRIEVNGEEIVAQKIILACGSSPFIPTPLRHLIPELDTSDTIFELEELPESIAVIGLGVIALELGQAFHRLGVRTTLFGHSGRIGPFTLPEMQSDCLKVLSKELDIVPAGKFTAARKEGSQFLLEFTTGAGETLVRKFERVVVASGRRSNVLNMEIAKSGLKLDDRGVPVYNLQTMQCGNAPIYLAGDANEDLPLWHEAYAEGRIAGDNALLFPESKPVKRLVPLGIYFSDPQIAMVGKKYSELDPSKIVIGRASVANGPRHKIYNVRDGQLSVFAKKESGMILGAEIFGKGAEHFAHYLSLAITHKMTLQNVLEAPFYHPCLEEVMKASLNQALFQLAK
ncbi:MAG: dihydrolipoyl dehydrogenase [Deltaproteobacteria bacterium]|nr:dihydrolipoyl dehydrogenase [Candidatus Tharpella aukensis]